MSLQLILGSSGAGKSHYLYHHIIEESLLHPDTNYLVLVPEQFTMEAQKDFIRMHKNHGILNIDVLSFMRLAYRIMEETNQGDVAVLEDTGKNMVLRKVLQEKEGDLIYFQANLRKPGFVDEVKSILSEFFQYQIGESELEEMRDMAREKPLLYAKLSDLLVIYEGFTSFLQNRYITPEEIMDILSDSLETSEWIRNSVICLDGFTGFTPSQYKVLDRIFSVAKKVYVTVTIDERVSIHHQNGDFQLFSLSKKTIHKLESIAFSHHLAVEEPIFPKSEDGTLWRFKNNKAMASLEANLFRYPYEKYQAEQDSIWMRELGNPKDEVRFVVRKMKEGIRSGYRYRDFAVVSGDMKSYGRLLIEEFSLAGIPFFLDEKRDIDRNPMVVMIHSILELLASQMDYESMFHYLRAGLLSFEKEEIDQLENYCLAFGIRGKKKWTTPFTSLGRDIKEEALPLLNQYRERVVATLEPVLSLLGTKKHTVGTYIERIYDVLVEQSIYERLSRMEEAFLEQGERLLAKEYSQVYQVVMELFERMMELLSEEEVTIREFQDILNAGIGKAKVGVIPSGIDQVVIGDIERTRLKDIRVLFFLGVNDGIVPKPVEAGGIFSDMEREMLKENQVELAPTRREKIYTERFYLYLNLTKPSDKLYLTYCKIDLSGKALKPSYLIGKVGQLFSHVPMEEESDPIITLMHRLDEDGGRNILFQGIRDFSTKEEQETIWNYLFFWYKENDILKEKLINYIKIAYPKQETGKISKAVAKALYGDNLVGSVTRLEQFAACAYAHFLSYGLRLRERQEFRINVPDMGNIFHAALELFSKKMEESGLTFRTISEEERNRLGEECIRTVTSDYGNEIFHSTKRNEYIIERMSRILRRTLWALTNQLSKGSFEPKGYELRFSYLDDLESVQIPLSNQANMNLVGRIDRVDICEKETELYVKVVDYKSGKKTFRIQDFYYGLELQLVVYMETMVEKFARDQADKTVIPAGIFYYNLDDPIVDKVDAPLYEDTLLKELRVNGLVNEKKEVIGALDASFVEDGELKPSVKSNVIPVETLKSGGFSKNSSVASAEQFDNIMRYARKKMEQLGKQMMEGQCSVAPYQLGDRTACEYCMYGSVCAFDKKAGSQFRVLEELDKEEILRRVEKGLEGGEEI